MTKAEEMFASMLDFCARAGVNTDESPTTITVFPCNVRREGCLHFHCIPGALVGRLVELLGEPERNGDTIAHWRATAQRAFMVAADPWSFDPLPTCATCGHELEAPAR